MPKKKRALLTRRKGGHKKKIAKDMAKKQFEQKSSNLRNQGAGLPCTILKEDVHENKLRFSVHQNVKPFIQNKCDVMESGNSIQSVVCNSVKIEQTDEVSVEDTVLYQPKYIFYRNCNAEELIFRSGGTSSQEDPIQFPIDQDFKHHITTDCGIIQSDISNQSPFRKSAKIEENDEISLENTMLYQPKNIEAGNSISQCSTDGSGYILSAEDATSSCFSDHVKKDKLTIPSKEEEKCVPTQMLATMKEGLLQNQSVSFNEKVFNESGSKLNRLLVDKLDHERRDQCQSCRYVGCSNTILKMHIESIDSYSKNYKCHLCDFVCDLKSKLKDHIGEVHLKLHTFHCSLKDSCSNKSSAIKGYKPVLTKGKWKLVCNDCDYNTILKDHMLLHLKSTTHRRKTFKCIYCDFSSIQYWSWKKHMDGVHFGVSSYKSNYVIVIIVQNGSTVQIELS